MSNKLSIFQAEDHNGHSQWRAIVTNNNGEKSVAMNSKPFAVSVVRESAKRHLLDSDEAASMLGEIANSNLAGEMPQTVPAGRIHAFLRSQFPGIGEGACLEFLIPRILEVV